MLKRIHINQHVIKENAKRTGELLPVITCKTSKTNNYYTELEIMDSDGSVAAKVIYSPDKPLSCGAKVWIETRAIVSGVAHDYPDPRYAHRDDSNLYPCFS